MLNGIAEKVIAVRGNCEAEVDQMVLDFPCMAEYNILLDPEANDGAGMTIFLTHGHVWGPGFTTRSTYGPSCRRVRRWYTGTRIRRLTKRVTRTPGLRCSTRARLVFLRTGLTAMASMRTAHFEFRVWDE